jgi:hypothetical protein
VLVLDRSGFEYEYHFIEDERDCWTKSATSKLARRVNRSTAC